MKNKPSTTQEEPAPEKQTNVGLDGYAPRQWAQKVLKSPNREKALAQVPDTYQKLVQGYLKIHDARKANANQSGKPE